MPMTCWSERCANPGDTVVVPHVHDALPMSDARLAEIERLIAGWDDVDPSWVIGDERMMTSDILCALVAEVRRLKRALHLSELSRGVPSMADRIG